MAYITKGVTDQYLRVWRLILSGEMMPQGGGGSGEILSSEVPTGHGDGLMTRAAGLRIVFSVTQATSQTPNTAEITIYNLADDFANRVIKENDYVILQAGYEWGQAGTIFTGTIKQYKKGHDSATDSYLKIYAADGDRAINQAFINTTIKPNTPPKDVLERLRKTMEEKGVGKGLVDESAVIKTPNIRDDVQYGPTADRLRDFANQNSALWHVLHQRFYYAKPQSYDPGAIIELNELTGLVGFPEMTQDGITLTALINPAIRLRMRIKLNNALINTFFLPGADPLRGGGTYDPTYNPTTAPPGSPPMGGAQLSNRAPPILYAKTNADGIYSPWVIQYEGDSRGQAWYMRMTCLTVDSSADSGAGFVPGGADFGFM